MSLNPFNFMNSTLIIGVGRSQIKEIFWNLSTNLVANSRKSVGISLFLNTLKKSEIPTDFLEFATKFVDKFQNISFICDLPTPIINVEFMKLNGFNDISLDLKTLPINRFYY